MGGGVGLRGLAWVPLSSVVSARSLLATTEPATLGSRPAETTDHLECPSVASRKRCLDLESRVVVSPQTAGVGEVTRFYSFEVKPLQYEGSEIPLHRVKEVNLGKTGGSH
ncbi:hypothetical protein Bbelb_193910 [Branchiostoma belcheri]|nr:hypothetical protein Bbelb_193910 [Branchiostoma belcheri]